MSDRVRRLQPKERDSTNIREKLIATAYRIMASPKNANRDRLGAMRILIDVALSEDSSANDNVERMFENLEKLTEEGGS